jgi:hypothetical protein
VFYRFNYPRTAATSIVFDTLGLAQIPGPPVRGPALQVASLYVPVGPAAVLPEPGTWALAFAGLCALAVTRRGRDALKR